MTTLTIRRTPRKGYRDGDYKVYREWIEWQVRDGRRVLSRHETKAEAELEKAVRESGN